ncbi:MAG: energy-coupling factor ABC transporter ATP-binding protein [Nanobdellota archaeon]
MIEIENLHYSYPDGKKALDDVSLNIGKGTTAIIGKNGAGKSTLLNHLNGVLLPNKGKIKVDGLEVKKKNLREIRKKVGIVFQNPDNMLFSPTVLEDVAFGPENLGMDNINERTESALDKVGATHLKNKNPHNLSTGQKKRVSIAAVISMEPSVIIFDEPTVHLDPKSKKEIIKLINSIDAVKIITTHDMKILRHCDKIHIMDEGKIVHSGRSIEEETLKTWELD